MSKKLKPSNVSFSVEIKHKYEQIPFETLLKKAIETEFSEIKDESCIEFFYTGYTNNALNYKCRIQVKGNDMHSKKEIKEKAKKRVEEVFRQNNMKTPSLVGISTSK